MDRIAYGFVDRGEGAVGLVDGRRRVERHRQHGWVERVDIEGIDAAGEPFAATGQALSRIIINRHSFIDVNSLMHWTIRDGGRTIEWSGEDQDMWPVHRWSAAKRRGDWTLRP
jgi:hypothetical protein